MNRRVFLTAIALTIGFVFSAALPARAHTVHKIMFHVDENDPARMNLVLNNAQNVNNYYKAKGEIIQIEIVAYGPGLNMLVADKSPVKARVSSMSLAIENLRFSACNNTHQAMIKKAGKDVPLLSEAKVVPSGVVRLVYLQEAGWSYLRP